MRRSLFLGAVSASFAPFAFGVAPARATGGLDIGDAVEQHVVRILLASGNYAAPQRLDAWHFAWNGRTYRGTASTVALDNGTSGLLDTLPLDAYLYGVLSKEVSPAWPAQAQAAQAIVARTFALGRLRPKKPYDLVASESDQRYDGIEGETPEGREAIDATAGIVVTYGGTGADVAYSACCGGHTADPADVWRGARDLPYLTGLPDPHCVGTPGYRWTADVALESLASLCNIERLSKIDVRDLDPSGRARTIALVAGATSIVPAGDFRATARLPSTLIASVDFDRAASVVRVAGFGRGHGVGFCQWGARAFAARGAAASDIVAFYFPGTTLGRA